MVKLIKIDGTVIIGAILLSTIEQVKFIDKQFNVLKTLINDLNRQKFD